MSNNYIKVAKKFQIDKKIGDIKTKEYDWFTNDLKYNESVKYRIKNNHLEYKDEYKDEEDEEKTWNTSYYTGKIKLKNKSNFPEKQIEIKLILEEGELVNSEINYIV